jgi:hypothetical protein
MRPRRSLTTSVCLLIVALATFRVAAWGQSYTVTDLGAVHPTAVINGPIVFGNLGPEPVVWEAGQVTPLQHLGHGGQVNGANARGDAVGWVWVNVQGTLMKHAALWYPEGHVTLLPGSGETEAHGVNMNRIIAGSHLTARHALRWVPGQPEEVLPMSTSGRAVDATGRVWGVHGNEPVAWDLNGTRHGFGAIGVIQAGPGDANDTRAVGGASRSASVSDAAYFFIPMAVTRLRAPDASLDRPFCGANAINNRHVAVGSCSDTGADRLAMLWPDQHTILNLNDVANAPFVLEFALGISEDGHIVGQTGDMGWLLSPVSPPVVSQPTPVNVGALLDERSRRDAINELVERAMQQARTRQLDRLGRGR